MQNILLVGATGNLGSRLVKELVKHQKDVHALIRPETMKNPKKVNPLKELGVRLVEGDLNDPVSLDKACAGMDAVISAVGGGQIMLQEGLVEAARAAGVKRFIPSEFGVDPHAAGQGACDLFDAKAVIQKKIKAAGLPYTMIYSNSFMDFWASGLGQLGNRAESGTVELYGDGKVKAPMTAISDIARFTVAILDDPEMKNREVRITANVTTQENLIATWERIHHKTIERKRVSRQDLTRIIQNAAKPEDAGKRVVAQLHRSVWIDGDAMKLRAETVEATRQYPDLPIKTLQVFFSKITADVAK